MRHCLGGLAQAHRRQLPNLGAGSLAVGSRAPAALPQPVHAASSPCPWTLPPGPALLGLVLWRPNPCQLGPVLPPSPCSRGACVQGWASALALLPRPRLLWTWTRPPHGACSPSAGGDFGWVVLAAPRVLRVIARPCPGPLQGQDGCWDQEGPSSAPKQVAGARGPEASQGPPSISLGHQRKDRAPGDSGRRHGRAGSAQTGGY